MGSPMRPLSDSTIELTKKSVSLQTHPNELVSRDFKTLLNMISEYEKETIPLKLDPEVKCASVQKNFCIEEYDNYRNQVEASVQTDKQREQQHVVHACHCRESIGIQANLDEEFKVKPADKSQQTSDAATFIHDTKPSTTSTAVQTQSTKKIHTNGVVPNGIPKSRKNSSGKLHNELEVFKLELQHMFNIMKCEQHILDLRFSILETRHEVVDDRVIGLLKYMPEAMAHINPRPRKRVSMFTAMRHFLREALFGSLLVAILSFSTLYTTLVNILKYNYA